MSNELYRQNGDRQIINAERNSDIHKETVRPDLDSSVKETLIRQSDYREAETRRPANYYGEQGGRTAYTSEVLPAQHHNNLGKSFAAYGAERSVYSNSELGGGAIATGSKSMINRQDKLEVNRSFVNSTVSESVKNGVAKSSIYADQTWGSRAATQKGLIRTVGGVVGRELEVYAAGRGDGGLSDRTRNQAAKYGLKGVRLGLAGAAVAGRGVIRIGKYGKRLAGDVKAGVLTGKEARRFLVKRTGKSLVSSGASIGKVIKGGVVKGIEDFQGSDDLGMQALTKPRDVIVKTRRTLSVFRSTGRTIWSATKRVGSAARTAGAKAIEAGRAAIIGVKRLATNPAAVKAMGAGLAVVTAVAIVMSVASVVTSIIPTITLKSDDWELTKTFDYITELDARMEEDIFLEDTRWHIPSISQYNYFINGVQVSKEQMQVYTNADLMLAYFDSKYDDYQLDKILLFFGGTSVRAEIELIHAQLHQLTKTRWQYTEDCGTADTADDYTVYCMDISLTTKSFDDYLADNFDTLLTQEEQQKLDAIQQAGYYTMRQELGSPFVGVDWSASLTSRFGWRMHPVDSVLSHHPALDIAMPNGTPINAVMSGTATVIHSSSGYGNHVIITDINGNYTLYAHMESTAVADGAYVKSGDVIGYVGSTGTSTGNHLHIEYYKDGHKLNPVFFLQQ